MYVISGLDGCVVDGGVKTKDSSEHGGQCINKAGLSSTSFQNKGDRSRLNNGHGKRPAGTVEPAYITPDGSRAVRRGRN